MPDVYQYYYLTDLDFRGQRLRVALDHSTIVVDLALDRKVNVINQLNDSYTPSAPKCQYTQRLMKY